MHIKHINVQLSPRGATRDPCRNKGTLRCSLSEQLLPGANASEKTSEKYAFPCLQILVELYEFHKKDSDIHIKDKSNSRIFGHERSCMKICV